MPLAGAWCKLWIYFGLIFTWTEGARPRFDTSTDMGLVLVPADAEIDSVIFRLRATDQDADFPLVFEITATITPVVRIENLPCTLYNKVCQANVILTKRLIPGRLHDFAVRVKDTKGDSNSMQATISVTNATTPRDKIFPHIPSLVMVPEDTKPGKELDYLLVRANSWSGKPVYIELWQPKELFTIRQRQTPTQTRGIITLIGELDFETQSMYTLTMYATDPYTEPGKDTRNIAGLNVVVVVRDVQDVPPIFTLAPPLTRINNSVQPGDLILRVHAEDGDKGVPREIIYGLVSESNPFTPFFNISETTGEIILARPLEELTQITHVGAPVVLTVVAEEIRRNREEPPAQATVVDVGFLLGEPGNSPPYFENDNYVATIDENPAPGTVINFGEHYTTKVKDEDIGKAGVFALKLENNNGTFEINPTVAERNADFLISVRDNTLIDYELYKSLSFKIVAQEVGPATNLSTTVPVTIFLRDINDNPPVFDEEVYEVTLSENVTAGTRVIQVHATDKDTGILGSIKYTSIIGQESDGFVMDPDTGLITVAMGSSLDREIAPRLLLSVEARDENGNGNRGAVPLIVNLIDVNDNAPLFEKDFYEFMLNSDLTNFTTSVFIKAIDNDAEPPNNEVRYELIHGNYENKFYLNEITGELILRSPITKIRRKKQSSYNNLSKKMGKEFVRNLDESRDLMFPVASNRSVSLLESLKNNRSKTNSERLIRRVINKRRKRANEDALYTLTARAYDLGVPHLSSVTQIRILSGIAMEARIVMFVVPGEHPDSTKTAETLAAITGGRVTVLETRPYIQQNRTGDGNAMPGVGKKSIVVARVEQTEPGTPLVDVEKIREALAANGVGIIGGSDTETMTPVIVTKSPVVGPTGNDGQSTVVNNTITGIQNEEVTVYKAENKLLFWLLIILLLLILATIAALIICCICPGCPFYMAPRKRRVHSSETLVVRSDGRTKRHLQRNPAGVVDAIWNGRKQAWSADPTRRNWQFNRRNTKNCGLSSLPGDVAYISGLQNDVQVKVEPLRPRDMYDPPRRSRIDEQERMYMEDVEVQKVRGYDASELDSLQRHEMERSSDVHRHGYRQRSGSRYMETDINEETGIREQHFYREGNAEVLRLVTRGQVDDTTMSHHHHHHPTTLVVDGKDIILKRFMEDQSSRHERSMQDIEAACSMESHQRSRDLCQPQKQEIILIPERLEFGHRQHIDELGPNVQRLLIDRSDYGSQKMDSKEPHVRDRQERQEKILTKEHLQSANTQPYPFHDFELARQNALLTRLLLEKENRHVSGGVMDSTSYLETQSLPGQVAIATQTDRTAATQTDRQVRSRSDNDESDEDSRHRKKFKTKKKYADGDWKRTRTLWMKSPIEEEGSPCFDKRLSILRKKVREVKEGRKIPLEPDVLREISDSLDDNGESSFRGEEEESTQRYQGSSQQTSIRYKVLNEDKNGSPSSMEISKEKYERGFEEKTLEQKAEATESTSSPEVKSQQERHTHRGKTDRTSSKKEAKGKSQRKSDAGKPSFRILEREITMLTKKLSKLGDKKFHDTTCSDSTSQSKSGSTSKDLKKDFEQKDSKKMDVSRGQKQATTATTSTNKMESITSQRKEAKMAKSRQKLKHQQAQITSTGSSEYDESFDHPKKQSSGFYQEAAKQKQPTGGQVQGKTKRQVQVNRREAMKTLQEQQIDKQKDSSEIAKSEVKPEKPEKPVRAPKLGAVARRHHVETYSSAANLSRSESKKDVPSSRGFDKKSNSELSGNGSNDSTRQKRQSLTEGMSEAISDFFVEEPKKQATHKETASVAGTKERTIDQKIMEEKSSNDDRIKTTESRVEDTKITIKKSSTEEVQQVTTKKNILEESIKDYSFSADTAKAKDNLIELEKNTLETEFVTIEESKKQKEGDKLPNSFKSDIEKRAGDAFEMKEKDKLLVENKPLTETKNEAEQFTDDEFQYYTEEDISLKNAEKQIDKTNEIEQHGKMEKKVEHVDDAKSSLRQDENDDTAKQESSDTLSIKEDDISQKSDEFTDKNVYTKLSNVYPEQIQQTITGDLKQDKQEEDILVDSDKIIATPDVDKVLINEMDEHIETAKSDISFETQRRNDHLRITERDVTSPEIQEASKISVDRLKSMEKQLSKGIEIEVHTKQPTSVDVIVHPEISTHLDHQTYTKEDPVLSSRDEDREEISALSTEFRTEDIETSKALDKSSPEIIEDKAKTETIFDKNVDDSTISTKDEIEKSLNSEAQSDDDEVKPLADSKELKKSDDVSDTKLILTTDPMKEYEKTDDVFDSTKTFIKESLEESKNRDEFISSKIVLSTESTDKVEISNDDKYNSEEEKQKESIETQAEQSDIIEKEKIDSIATSASIDSTDVFKAEELLQFQDEQHKLEEDLFAVKETSIETEDKSKVFVEKQLDVKQDSNETFRLESSEQDIIRVETDSTLNLEERVREDAYQGEVAVAEHYADVSLPLFTSIIDTMDDSDESDSSSDISRKTTLTTRPYQTPRHRAQKSPEITRTEMENTETKTIESDEETTLTVELIEDKIDECSKPNERIGETQDVNIELIKTPRQADYSGLNKKLMGVAPSATLSPEKVFTALDEQKTAYKCTKARYSSDADPSNSSKYLKHSKFELEKKYSTCTSDEKNIKTTVEPRRIEEKKTKQSEKVKASPQRKKKYSSDETSENKTFRTHDHAHHSQSKVHKQKDNIQTKQSKKPDDEQRRKYSLTKSKSEKETKLSARVEKSSNPPKTGDIDTSKAQPKYMAWYKKKREEMEKKRAELKAADDEEQLPRWLRRSMRNQKTETIDSKRLVDRKTTEITPRTRRKVKPLVNVESEQLKAIVRQGRKLRKAEGGSNEDPPVQIFASSPPAPVPDTKHHLVQHSEYKYEKIPPPFYLHPPPAPHPSPQLSPQHFEPQSTMEYTPPETDLDASIAISVQGGNRLRHQQLLEKKSVFDIAYNEAAPSQLRADSTTPPS